MQSMKMKTCSQRDIRIATTDGFYATLLKKILSDRDYLFLIGKLFKIKILKQKTPIFAICDLNNICNLKCKHCYWWLNRDGEKPELTADDWRTIINEKIKKNHILQVHLVGGEPMLRPDIIEVFNEEMPGKFTMLTNGTKKLIPYDGLIVYGISIDGMKETHDKIRGKTFDIIEKNVREYVEETGKKVWISMTVNSWNYKEITGVAEYWKELAATINFQFHTPFMENDPLWIPYGDKKNEVLDKIIALRRKYPNYVINEEKQLNLLRATWGGNRNGPTNCPNWAIITLDHQGQQKRPCCIGGSGKDDMMPMCENCGMSNYASLYVRGIHL
jgi:MoaA/NifB/PqqE/SkfB family radical SAM enzyme